jgi:glycerol-3-phosphate acyltransferase PlsX
VKHVWNVEDPRVGLINIGEEEGKGNLLAQAAYPLLKEQKNIRFIGNIEGRDILMDNADVMVCEGFTETSRKHLRYREAPQGGRPLF